jgi:hypothetical protein
MRDADRRAMNAVVGERRILARQLRQPLRGEGGARVNSEASVDVSEVLLYRLWRHVQGSGCSVIGVAAADEVSHLALAQGQTLGLRAQISVSSKDAGHRRP